MLTYSFLQWLFQVTLSLKRPNGKKSLEAAGVPVVYLFIYSLPAVSQLRDFLTELAQIQIIKLILLGSLGLDLLSSLQFRLHGSQQRLLQVQVVFNFLS